MFRIVVELAKFLESECFGCRNFARYKDTKKWCCSVNGNDGFYVSDCYDRSDLDDWIP